MRVAQIDNVYRAIADPTRRQILQLLVEKERTVGAIGEHFTISQPAISQHMRVLKDAGLVSSRADWRSRVYQVTPIRLQEVLGWVRLFEGFWDEALDRLDQALNQTSDDSV